MRWTLIAAIFLCMVEMGQAGHFFRRPVVAVRAPVVVRERFVAAPVVVRERVIVERPFVRPAIVVAPRLIIR